MDGKGRDKTVRYWEMRVARGQLRAQRRGRRGALAGLGGGARPAHLPARRRGARPPSPPGSPTLGVRAGRPLGLPFTCRPPGRGSASPGLRTVASLPLDKESAREHDDARHAACWLQRPLALSLRRRGLRKRSKSSSDHAPRPATEAATTGRGAGHHRRRTGTTTAPAGISNAQRHAQRLRRDVPEGLLRGGRSPPSAQGPRGVTINYGGGGSGKGRQDLADQLVDFAGTDGTDQGRRPAQVQGRRRPLLPDGRRPDHGDLQPRRASTSCSSRPTTIAKIFQRADHEVERPGDRRRQPRRHAARPGHHRRAPRRRLAAPPSNFTKFLEQRRSATAATASGRSAAARPSSGPPTPRPATATAASPRSSAPPTGAIGYVDLSDARGQRLHVRHRQEQGRQVRRARRSTAPRPPPPASTINDDLTFFAGLGRRRRRLPDHRARPGSSSTRSRPTRPRPTALQGVPQLHAHRRPDAGARTIELRPAARATWRRKAIAQLDSHHGRLINPPDERPVGRRPRRRPSARAVLFARVHLP